MNLNKTKKLKEIKQDKHISSFTQPINKLANNISQVSENEDSFYWVRITFANDVSEKYLVLTQS